MHCPRDFPSGTSVNEALVKTPANGGPLLGFSVLCLCVLCFCVFGSRRTAYLGMIGSPVLDRGMV